MLPSSVHPRLLQWILILFGYTYNIIYSRNEKFQIVASRLHLDTPTEDQSESDNYTLNINQASVHLTKLQNSIKEDRDMLQMYQWVKMDGLEPPDGHILEKS